MSQNILSKTNEEYAEAKAKARILFDKIKKVIMGIKPKVLGQEVRQTWSWTNINKMIVSCMSRRPSVAEIDVGFYDTTREVLLRALYQINSALWDAKSADTFADDLDSFGRCLYIIPLYDQGLYGSIADHINLAPLAEDSAADAAADPDTTEKV